VIPKLVLSLIFSEYSLSCVMLMLLIQSWMEEFSNLSSFISVHLPIFKLDYFLFWCLLFWALYIFWILITCQVNC
jgi:hypothetical protein